MSKGESARNGCLWGWVFSRVVLLLAAPAAFVLSAAGGKVLLDEALIGDGSRQSERLPWTVEGGEARLTEEGLEVRNSGTDAFAMRGVVLGREDWTDYRLSFDVRLTSPGQDWRDGVWVGVRYQAGLNAYVVGFYAGRLYLYKILQDRSVTGSTPVVEVRDRRAGLRDSLWHRLEVTAQGTRLTVAIDGDVLLETVDDGGDRLLSPLRRGCVMLGARKWSESDRDAVALFKNVRVVELPGVEEKGADVSVDTELARAIQPWRKRDVWPRYDEYVGVMQGWATSHPDTIAIEEAGRSLEGKPILVARVTDTSVSDADKHVILVTALDAGGERTGASAALRTIEWLLGESELACLSRRHHVVVVMPIPNPYGYERGASTNSKGINPYHGGRGRGDAWDLTGPKLKGVEDAPHLAAFTRIVDRYQPDVHIDLHGVGLAYAGQLVQPSVGSAYSNISNRPWDWRLLEHMIHYAGRAGYGYNRMEVDAQRLFAGDTMAAMSDLLWFGRPFFYSAHYGYAKYHTMPCTSEVAWEQGGVELVKGLLDFGNRQFGACPVPRLPVDRARYCVGNYTVCAYGRTVAERRASRVELWQRQREIGLGFLYNYTDGRDMVVCTLGTRGYQAVCPEPGPTKLDTLDVVRRLRQLPYVEAGAVESFVMAGPQRHLYLDVPRKPEPEGADFRHGLAIEFPVYYREPELVHVRLNGHRLAADALDGYQAWYSEWEGYTIVRVNIPAGGLAGREVFVVTCAYVPDVQRSYGWQKGVSGERAIKGR